MISKILLLLLSGGFFAGCQTASPQDLIWLRTDGQSQVGRPDLLQQFEIDSTICKGEAQKSAVAAPIVYTNGSVDGAIGASIVSAQQGDAVVDVAKGCMAQHGYLLVPKSQAAALSAQFKANRKL